MTRWERLAFNVLGGVVSASGLVYAWMKYGMATDDPFALVNHPLQPAMLKVHLMASPWFILSCGVLIGSHVMAITGRGPSPNRRTGFVTLASVLAMTFSGYGLQVFTAPVWTRAMLALHLASAGLFLVIYGVHLVIALRASDPYRTCEPEADRGAV